jgi:hypothetical protein
MTGPPFFVGQRFGLLVVREQVFHRTGRVLVNCDCGMSIRALRKELRAGRKTHCGAMHRTWRRPKSVKPPIDAMGTAK